MELDISDGKSLMTIDAAKYERMRQTNRIALEALEKIRNLPTAYGPVAQTMADRAITAIRYLGGNIE